MDKNKGKYAIRALLRSYAACSGKSLKTFRNNLSVNLSVTSVEVKNPPEYGTYMLYWNVGKDLLLHIA